MLTIRSTGDTTVAVYLLALGRGLLRSARGSAVGRNRETVAGVELGQLFLRVAIHDGGGITRFVTSQLGEFFVVDLLNVCLGQGSLDVLAR